MRSSRRAPLSGPIAPSTATVGHIVVGQHDREARGAARGACRRRSPLSAMPRRRARRARSRRPRARENSARACARSTATARSGTPSARAARDGARARRRCRRRANAGCAARQRPQTAGVGLRAAVHPVGAEERDRRAREIEVVHGVAVGNRRARRARSRMPSRQPETLCRWTRPMPNVAHRPPTKSRHGSSTCRREVEACARRRRRGAPRPASGRRPRWRDSAGNASRDASISARTWCSVPPPWPWMTCSTPAAGRERARRCACAAARSGRSGSAAM